MKKFWTWFASIRWLKIPAWVFVVVGALNNARYSSAPLTDFIGGLIFALVCFFVYFILKERSGQKDK